MFICEGCGEEQAENENDLCGLCIAEDEFWDGTGSDYDDSPYG